MRHLKSIAVGVGLRGDLCWPKSNSLTGGGGENEGGEVPPYSIFILSNVWDKNRTLSRCTGEKKPNEYITEKADTLQNALLL